ncbi:hypothetical protein BDW62DRAFT_194275 [Aspergillus aurantiobrunneus]
MVHIFLFYQPLLSENLFIWGTCWSSTVPTKPDYALRMMHTPPLPSPLGVGRPSCTFVFAPPLSPRLY